MFPHVFLYLHFLTIHILIYVSFIFLQTFFSKFYNYF
nr:MAG TPA: hypothetical protein [Caudoviricetes sp.]